MIFIFPILRITHILALFVKYHKEKISLRFIFLPLFYDSIKTIKEKLNDYIYKLRSKI